MSESGSPRLPISAIVASRNEAPLLEACLPTIRFCDEIIVIDLESSDATAALAAAQGARVVPHPYVPSVERARADVVRLARHDWLLYTDPDEELPPSLAEQLAEHLPTLEPDVAIVFCPIQYYFGKRALRGTVWGGIKERRLLVRRDAVHFSSAIYSGATALSGYRQLSLPFTGDNAIVHHWVSGYRNFFAKHLRYMRLEGEDRCRNGEAMGYRAVLRTPWQRFYESFVTRKGFLDGATGFALSVLWALYATGANVALLRRLRRAEAPLAS